MNDQTVTPKWRLTRVAYEDDDNLKLTCVDQTESALEITTDGKTTLNTSLTVNGPLTLAQPVSASRGPVRVTGGLSVSGAVEVPGGITGPGAVPKGVVVMWAGDPAHLPEGWALCDGQNGRPDLRGRFPVGADGGSFPAHQAGGSREHSHHIDHTYRLTSTRDADGKNFGVIAPETLQRLTCDTHHASHLPPYLALHFIIKL
ncbi:hypothetical protein [Ancylobacter sp. IITR112]|uniref:hypothetical protein n=1 Tax=Ancylobacter sp. IITR112 TaxID=3138073 RepID=UPI00352A0A58